MNKMNGNKILKEAKDDEADLVISYFMNKAKLFFILEHFKDIPADLTQSNNRIRGIVKAAKEGNIDVGVLEIDKKSRRYFEKQTFSDLFIMTGISCFEKYCKDWFVWGLKYSPNRLNFFGKKQILVLELIKSKDIKETLINKIVDDINFQNTEICNNMFKEVFNFEIFDPRDERYKFEKYLNHRHIISHNLGFIDNTYIKKMKQDKLRYGNLLVLKEDELLDFEDRLDNIIDRIKTNMTKIIYLEIEKNIKNDNNLNKNFANTA